MIIVGLDRARTLAPLASQTFIRFGRFPASTTAQIREALLGSIAMAVLFQIVFRIESLCTEKAHQGAEHISLFKKDFSEIYQNAFDIIDFPAHFDNLT